MKSDVYFAPVESNTPQERAEALKRILVQSQESRDYKKGEFLPVKITIGDSACVYHVSPELVGLVISSIKDKGAEPFVFDTSVIYKGQRQNAVDHMRLAESKGFGFSALQAPFIVADGVFGQDGREFNLNEPHIKKIKTPSFVSMLESLVVLSHATGHIVSGYAGAIKNVAMGMSCRPTKQAQHSSLKPKVIQEKCTACGCCIAICPVSAIAFKPQKAFIDQDICIGCSECLCACKFDAIYINWKEQADIFCARMVEVAGFILSKFKSKFFINFAFDVTKDCDCISGKGEKMICGDIGILASSDIVSLDKATFDLALEKKKSDFLPESRGLFMRMLEYAEEKGLGRLEYNLVKV